MDRIRKALVAAGAAFLAAFVAAMVNAMQAGGGLTAETISSALGMAVAASALAGYTTWRVPNAR